MYTKAHLTIYIVSFCPDLASHGAYAESDEEPEHKSLPVDAQLGPLQWSAREEECMTQLISSCIWSPEQAAAMHDEMQIFLDGHTAAHAPAWSQPDSRSCEGS